MNLPTTLPRHWEPRMTNDRMSGQRTHCDSYTEERA